MKKMKHMIFVLLALAIMVSACGTRTELAQEDLQKTMVAESVAKLLTQESLLAATETKTEVPTEDVPTETPTLEPEPTEGVKMLGPTNFPNDVNPLTGLKVADPSILNRLPVLVKVPNYPAYGRPHGGLSSADIVFETWIGGGSNRFIALYYGQNSDFVWPVRSIRIVDPEIASLYKGVIVYSGGDAGKVLPKVYQIMGNRLFPEGTCPGICDRGTGDVTRLYANTEAVTDYFKSDSIDPGTRPNLDGMVFSETVPNGGKVATKAEFYFNEYNKGDWVYDQASGKYLRWIEDGYTYEMIPLVDTNTNEQLAFSNFVMLFANHIELETQLIDIRIWDNTEGQKAVIFRDGQAFEVTWKANNHESPITFYDKDGNLFPLKPGNTWIGITGLSSPQTVEGETWHFDFQMP